MGKPAALRPAVGLGGINISSPESKPPSATGTPAPGTVAGPAVPAHPGGTPPAPTAPRQPRLAILEYHEVDDRNSNAYTVTSAQFESQVKMLLEEGYAFYHLADVERLLAGGESMPERAVLLAFDDGYTSFYTHVMPIARKYNVPATCFVVTKYLDQVVVGGRPHMSSQQTRDLIASPLADLAEHSYDGHREGITADGSIKPVLTHRMRKEGGEAVESEQEYRSRVLGDFKKSTAALIRHGATYTVRHFAFPFTARSNEVVRLGQQAGIEYFYGGGETLVTPETDRTAIPRVNAGAPEITAEVLRSRLRNLFDQP